MFALITMLAPILLLLVCIPLPTVGDGLEASLANCCTDARLLAARVAELEEKLAAATSLGASQLPLASMGTVSMRGAAVVPEHEKRHPSHPDESVFGDDVGNAASPLASSFDRRLGEPDELTPVGSPEFYQNVVCSLVCVMLAALAAGLTMGLVSLEKMDMEIIVKTEEKDITNSEELLKLKESKQDAQALLPLVQDHHRLLVTLLLMNSFANEALPLFLDQLVPSWLAVLMSMTLVLIFGEIIPSAIFTGSHQLRMAASFSPFVVFFRWVLAPVAYPIAQVLDLLLGADHKGRYNFAELRAVVDIHSRLHGHAEAVFESVGDQSVIMTTKHEFTDLTAVTFTSSDRVQAKSSILIPDSVVYFADPHPAHRGGDLHSAFRLYRTEERRAEDLIELHDGDITSGVFKVKERDELIIMSGLMKLTHMVAREAMMPLSKVEMLEQGTTFDKSTLQDILNKGYSRLPLYDQSKHNVRGFLLVKKLIVISPDGGNKAENYIQQMVVVGQDIGMLDLLNKFQERRIHMALVTDSPEVVDKAWQENTPIPPDVHMAGIITLEDIIERLIQEEIEDEHDAPSRRPSKRKNDLSFQPRSPRQPRLKHDMSPSVSRSGPTDNKLAVPLLTDVRIPSRASET